MGTESESKEPIQVVAGVTADHLSRIASIIAGAVRDIAQEIGKWANDLADARTVTPPADAAEEKPAPTESAAEKAAPEESAGEKPPASG
jgi:hypothetical protein